MIDTFLTDVSLLSRTGIIIPFPLLVIIRQNFNTIFVWPVVVRLPSVPVGVSDPALIRPAELSLLLQVIQTDPHPGLHARNLTEHESHLVAMKNNNR